MYVHIFGYLVNKLEIWWVYLSPIENGFTIMWLCTTYFFDTYKFTFQKKISTPYQILYTLLAYMYKLIKDIKYIF